MKKSVLLGIVAVTLFSLPALAGEVKFEGGWPGHWVWDWQDTGIRIPVKMIIPWYVHITNQDPIWLEQYTSGCPSNKWPCFSGCNSTGVECNFNLSLACEVIDKAIGGDWGCSISPSNVSMPGGSVNICVDLKNADLLGKPANTEQHVANVKIKVKPQ